MTPATVVDVARRQVDDARTRLLDGTGTAVELADAVRYLRVVLADAKAADPHAGPFLDVIAAPRLDR